MNLDYILKADKNTYFKRSFMYGIFINFTDNTSIQFLMQAASMKALLEKLGKMFNMESIENLDIKVK